MIKFCRKCIMSDTRPRVVFNSDGICNACTNAEEKKKIDWKSREEEFKKLAEKIKKNKQSNYDCVVPWSGGKDSNSIALKLKFKYGLNPLLVTFSPLIINEIGQQNRESLSEMGFDGINFRPNQKIARMLSKRFFIERGNPKVAWDAGVNSIPIQIAAKYNIQNVFYAEHGESEYGGLVINKESLKYRDLREVIEHQIGDFPENWANEDISIKDLQPYIYPDTKHLSALNIKAYYFAYFFKWSMYENFKYVKKNMPNFKCNKNGRTTGTFTDFDSLDDKIDPLYYHMQYIKFGFGRATRDASRLIQNNEMKRSEAILMAKKYDHEFPEENQDEILDYLELSKDEFYNVIDKHRNQEIWKSSINNKWELVTKLT